MLSLNSFEFLYKYDVYIIPVSLSELPPVLGKNSISDSLPFVEDADDFFGIENLVSIQVHGAEECLDLLTGDRDTMSLAEIASLRKVICELLELLLINGLVLLDIVDDEVSLFHEVLEGNELVEGDSVVVQVSVLCATCDVIVVLLVAIEWEEDEKTLRKVESRDGVIPICIILAELVVPQELLNSVFEIEVVVDIDFRFVVIDSLADLAIRLKEVLFISLEHVMLLTELGLLSVGSQILGELQHVHLSTGLSELALNDTVGSLVDQHKVEELGKADGALPVAVDQVENLIDSLFVGLVIGVEVLLLVVVKWSQGIEELLDRHLE